MAKRTYDLATDVIATMEYDNLGRLTKGKADIAIFAYDALGRRIWKRDSTADANNVYYYNDQWQVLVDFNDSDVEQQRFVYGNYIDEPILMVANGVEYQYLYDHLYNTVALTNSTGTPYERYEYVADPWRGRLRQLHNPQPDIRNTRYERL